MLNLLDNIISNLEKELPGVKAWSKMAVKSKDGNIEKIHQYKEWLSEENKKKLKKASVLIALFEYEEDIAFPVIKRPMHEKNHPGQIALPGGSQENNEDLENTAIREAHEEIGIETEKIEIIGRLTPIPVPVSGYLIYPYIGLVEKEPEWKICKEEVDELFIIKMSELIDANNGSSEEWIIEDKKLDVPVFKVGQQTIWGATASVLSELLELTK